ncbi:hypothetical protein SEEN6907_22303, partial [Salmonella enterica subsp. enterica serovar Newport str. VA_R100506907]
MSLRILYRAAERMQLPLILVDHRLRLGRSAASTAASATPS